MSIQILASLCHELTRRLLCFMCICRDGRTHAQVVCHNHIRATSAFGCKHHPAAGSAIHLVHTHSRSEQPHAQINTAMASTASTAGQHLHSWTPHSDAETHHTANRADGVSWRRRCEGDAARESFSRLWREHTASHRWWGGQHVHPPGHAPASMALHRCQQRQ